jgi:hypothetical protein
MSKTQVTKIIEDALYENQVERDKESQILFFAIIKEHLERGYELDDIANTLTFLAATLKEQKARTLGIINGGTVTLTWAWLFRRERREDQTPFELPDDPEADDDELPF